MYAGHSCGQHQRYCSTSLCRKASKLTSQRRWAHQFSNRSHFRGEREVQRVQEWRREHPGYWRKQKPASQRTQPADPQPVNPEQKSRNVPRSDLSTLQEICLTQHPAFVGLISMVTGSTLQEDIALTSRNLLLRGQNILGLKSPGQPSSTTPSSYEKTPDPTRSPSSGPHQL
jgi:hypothetical protein